MTQINAIVTTYSDIIYSGKVDGFPMWEGEQYLALKVSSVSNMQVLFPLIEINTLISKNGKCLTGSQLQEIIIEKGEL